MRSETLENRLKRLCRGVSRSDRPCENLYTAFSWIAPSVALGQRRGLPAVSPPRRSRHIISLGTRWNPPVLDYTFSFGRVRLKSTSTGCDFPPPISSFTHTRRPWRRAMGHTVRVLQWRERVGRRIGGVRKMVERLRIAVSCRWRDVVVLYWYGGSVVDPAEGGEEGGSCDGTGAG